MLLRATFLVGAILFAGCASPALAQSTVINEIVADPQTDWNASGGVTTTDEYIELANTSDTAVSLDGWTIQMDDTTPATQLLSGTIEPHGFLVIQNPSDTINNDGQILLRNAEGDPVDSVTLGAWDDGDPEDNAPSGNATAVTNEAISRNKHADDTDRDADDWYARAASPGAKNPNSSPEISITSSVQTVYAGETVTFLAAARDVDHDEISYQWTITQSGATQVTCTQSSCAFTPHASGETIATLKVSDSEGATSEVSLTITVLPQEEEEETPPINPTTPTEIPTTAPTGLAISEVLPDPAGSDTGNEWIEITNTSGDTVSLIGVRLDDADGGSSPYALSGTLAPGAFLVISNATSHITLNNTGDDARLLFGSTVLDSVHYGAAPEGKSYAKRGNDWSWETPTPGSGPSATLEDGEKPQDAKPQGKTEEQAETEMPVLDISSLDALKKTPINTRVRFTATITALPGTLYKSMGFLQDKKWGIAFAFEGDSSARRDEKITAIGVYKKRSGAPFLDHVIVEKHKKATTNGAKRETGAFKKGDRERLVTITSVITSQSGRTITLRDGVRLILAPTITKPAWKKGQTITATGVARQTKTGWRILARDQGDIGTGAATTAVKVAGTTNKAIPAEIKSAPQPEPAIADMPKDPPTQTATQNILQPQQPTATTPETPPTPTAFPPLWTILMASCCFGITTASTWFALKKTKNSTA